MNLNLLRVCKETTIVQGKKKIGNTPSSCLGNHFEFDGHLEAQSTDKNLIAVSCAYHKYTASQRTSKSELEKIQYSGEIKYGKGPKFNG